MSTRWLYRACIVLAVGNLIATLVAPMPRYGVIWWSTLIAPHLVILVLAVLEVRARRRNARGVCDE
jgi:hypothetical protein